MKKLVNESLDEFLQEGCSYPKTKKGKEKKFEKTMKKWDEGKLKTGKSDKKVPKGKRGLKQALAISYSESGQSKK